VQHALVRHVHVHKHKALEFNSVMKYVGELAGEKHYGAQAKFYKLNFQHVIDAYPGAGKLEKGQKMSKAGKHAKNISAYFQRLRHILNGHADGTTARDGNLFVTKVKIDKAIKPWIESGRHFFHPVGYKHMNGKDKKEAMHNVTNWSDAGTAEEYKKHLQEVQAMKTPKGMIYVPDLSGNWATMSGQEKYEYLTKKKDGRLVHWHTISKVKTDEAIVPWIESRRHFFHPVGYKRMNRKDKKEARHNVTNWSDAGTAEEYKKHLQEVKAMKTSEGMIYVPDLSKNWATMSGQAKYEYVTKKRDGKLVHWRMRNKEEYIAQRKAMSMQKKE
jgi:hypothetical protein